MPEFVVERLRSAAASDPAATGAHPDANLIAAFVERSIGKQERAQLLDHLARCGQCRDVVALALPEEIAVAARPDTARAWPWAQTLRWGAMAAAVAVLAIAVLVTKPFTGRVDRVTQVATDRVPEQQLPAPPAANSGVNTTSLPSVPNARVDRRAASSATRLAAEAKSENSLKAAAV